MDKVKRLSMVLAASLLIPLAGFAALPPAHAQGATNAICALAFSLHFSPGLTLMPSTGSDGSGGETGSISCTGTFDGHRVTGPGSFGFQSAVYTSTCLGDNAAGSTYFFTVPTDAGRKHFVGTVSDIRIGLTLVVKGSQPGAHVSGVFVVVPTKGDCLTAPLTDALGTGTAVISSGPSPAAR
jgi:hypothetical protein